jgi:serine protease Do/serine protease DegQ
VITKVNGKSVKTFSEIKAKIGSIGAGKTVKITVFREGDEKRFNVTLKKSATANIEAASIHRMLDGAELENNLDGRGIDVKEVAQDSPAALIGLVEGDVISGINRARLKNIAELRNFLKDRKGVFALNIIRGNTNLYLMIR